MNKNRRTRLEGALATLREIQEEEQHAFDALPEPFQNGQQGEKMQGTIDNLEEACCYLDDTLSNI